MCAASRRLIWSPAACRDLLSDGAACRLIGSPVVLSGRAALFAIVATAPIASMAFGACDTSNACLEDAGADNKAALCDVVCAKYPHRAQNARGRAVWF